MSFPLLAFLLPLALFALTAHRLPGLPDWAVLADAMARPELSVAAWNHPLANLLGWLLTRGALPEEFPSRMVWVSILPMAAACGLFILALARAGLPRPFALACGLAHAVGHSVWWHGTIAENYALSALFLSLSLFAGLSPFPPDRGLSPPNRGLSPPDPGLSPFQPDRGLSPSDQGLSPSDSPPFDRGLSPFPFRPAFLLFVLAGLSLANHVENAVLTLGAAAWLGAALLRSPPDARHGGKTAGNAPRALGAAALAWLAGAAPFLLLFAADAMRHDGVFASLAGGGFRSQMGQFAPATMGRRLLDLWALEYPSPFAIAAAAGLLFACLPFARLPGERPEMAPGESAAPANALPSPVRWQCAAVAVPVLLFSLSYGAWDRFAFFLPVFTVCDFLGAIVLWRCFHTLSARLEKRRLARRSLAAVSGLVLALAVLLPPFAYPRIPRRAKSGEGCWAERFGAIARQYERRGEMVGMLADPLFHDRGTLSRYARSLVETAPEGALIVDDMAFQHPMEWFARLPSSARPDLRFVSVVPPFLDGYGLDPAAAAAKIAFHPGPVLLTTTNGLCGAILPLLKAYGREPEPVALPEGREAFRIVRTRPPDLFSLFPPSHPSYCLSPMPTLFESALASGSVLITDGSFGTRLQAAGLRPGDCPEEWNLSHPDVVRGILERYRDAGSHVAKTNSFGASRIKLSRFGLAEKTAEINRAAAAIAREVSGPARLVFGSVGPTGEMMEPYGELTGDEVFAAFLEQARALADGGVDALLVETQSILEECVLAIRAGREAGLPVLASFTFSPVATGGYASMMGVRPADFAPAAIAAGACVVGTNCSNGPEHMAKVVEELRASVPPDFPLIAMPNAGLPVLRGLETVFPETPESMAAKVRAFPASGVRFLGGCCGTTPEHIAAIRKAVLD